MKRQGPRTVAWVLGWAWSLICSGLAHGTLLVVDQQAPGAADTNAATEAAPLRTIAAAVARARPGDTIAVKNGVYRETVVRNDLPWDQPNERITLMAWPTHRPVVKGSDVVTNRFVPVRVALRRRLEELARDTEYDPDAWRKRIGVDGPQAVPATPAAETNEALDHSRAEFVGIYACDWTNFTSLVFADEVMLTTIGLRCSPERVAKDPGGFRLVKEWEGQDVSDMRPGSCHYDAAGRKLYVWLPDGDDPNRHVIEAGVRGVGINLQGTWTVSGFDIRHFQDGWKTSGEVALVVFGHHPIIEHCRVTHNGYIGIIIHGWDGVLRNCEIAWNGLCGISPSLGWRMLIEGNEFHHNDWLGGVRCAHDGNKITSWKDTRILRNRFRDDRGLWLDINVNNTLIAENVFENCGCGVYFEISRWGVIVNNVFRNCNRGVWVYSSDTLVAHNVFDGCSEGVTISGYPRGAAYRQSYFDEEGGHGGVSDCLMAARNNLVLNNIIVDAVGSYLACTRDDAFGSANYSDYNVFAWTMPKIHWGSNHIKFMAGWDDYYGRLQFWRMDRHSDEHSVIADPTLYQVLRSGRAWPEVRPSDLVEDAGFVDRANGDYRLTPDSPLRGRGIVIPTVLNAVYLPATNSEIRTRAWARTDLQHAPEKRKAARASVWGADSYRIQPLPRVRRLVDLDAQPLGADPGLNLAWQRSGAYPHFRAEGEPETVPDDFGAVYPVNRLVNGDFNLGLFGAFQILDSEAKAVTGTWSVVAGQATIASGEARAELSATNRLCRVAQRLGPIQPDTEYLLWAQMKVEGRAEGGTVRGAVLLAAGPELKPLHGATTDAEGRRERHWDTVEAYYRSGSEAAADAAIGQDLYVVLEARAEGEAPAGVVRWDNVMLFSGEPVKR